MTSIISHFLVQNSILACLLALAAGPAMACAVCRRGLERARLWAVEKCGKFFRGKRRPQQVWEHMLMFFEPASVEKHVLHFCVCLSASRSLQRAPQHAARTL